MMAGMLLTKALNHQSANGWKQKRQPNPNKFGTPEHFLHELVEDMVSISNPVGVAMIGAAAPLMALDYVMDVVKKRETDAKVKQGLANATAKAKKEVEKAKNEGKSPKSKLADEYDTYREDFKKRFPEKLPEKKKHWVEKADKSPKDLFQKYTQGGGKLDFKAWRARYYDPWHKAAAEKAPAKSREEFLKLLQTEMPLDAFPKKGQGEMLALYSFFFKKQGWEEPTEEELSNPPKKESCLRSAVLRLANQRPELRQVLIPLLRKTQGL